MTDHQVTLHSHRVSLGPNILIPNNYQKHDPENTICALPHLRSSKHSNSSKFLLKHFKHLAIVSTLDQKRGHKDQTPLSPLISRHTRFLARKRDYLMNVVSVS